MKEEILALRKELHQHPELSGQESATASRIQAFVQDHHPTRIITGLGGHGLAVIYNYQNSGPTVAIRCELDALPIEEENTFAHRSHTKGVSHKCGHDGHMAMVSGLVYWLKEQAFSRGKVILLFQPAEETGQGAYRVLNDGKFKELDIDYFFALHNIPGAPLNSIITMQRGFSAEVQSLAIKLVGKEAHAAEPENGINPALAIAQITVALAELNVTDPQDDNFRVLTPVHLTMGQKAYGISPAAGELHYTIRTWNRERMVELKNSITNLVAQISAAHQLTHQVDWFEYFPASTNDSACNEYVDKAAKQAGLNTYARPYPFKFGEDFGWFSREYKSTMFGLGAGRKTPALHHADYDFPDEILDTGTKMFQAIISQILK
ncbi:MAG: amidohydrolase [Bacteroidota bacterium]